MEKHGVVRWILTYLSRYPCLCKEQHDHGMKTMVAAQVDQLFYTFTAPCFVCFNSCEILGDSQILFLQNFHLFVWKRKIHNEASWTSTCEQKRTRKDWWWTIHKIPPHAPINSLNLKVASSKTGSHQHQAHPPPTECRHRTWNQSTIPKTRLFLTCDACSPNQIAGSVWQDKVCPRGVVC
jgi:hypothetical protein